MRAALMHRGFGVVLTGTLVVAGCFESNTVREDGGTPDHRDAAHDAAAWSDAGMSVDGGMCERIGDVRLCQPYCGLRCPDGERYCNDTFAICQSTSAPDQRGHESCAVHLSVGNPYCYTGNLCVANETRMPTDTSWSGACVGQDYCRWIREQPELEHLLCRYSEGLPFENGPPSHECAPGAHPQNPFCGGACGDTCPAHFHEYPIGCAGISETRGFGVCVPDMRRRCDAAGLLWEDLGASCQNELLLGGAEDIACVCMVLAPVLMEEYADRGWVVSQQSCLAYRSRYPGEVRCFDYRGREL